MNKNKRELKIFLTFFLIYSFFAQWTSWNEESRFALIRAIIDEKRLQIDSFRNQTGDRFYSDGHYYSDKNPGSSFLAIPIYATWKLICHIFPQFFSLTCSSSSSELVYFVRSLPFTYSVDLNFFTSSSMFLVTIFTSSLFSALTVVLIYRISNHFTKNEKFRILSVITYGLGTWAFPYAQVFLDHALTTFFTFSTFFILFKIKEKKEADNKYFFLAGIFAGFAIVTGILASLIVLICLIYLVSFKKNRLFLFIIGVLIGVLPYLVYNYSILGSLSDFSYFSHIEKSVWSRFSTFGGFEFEIPFFRKYAIALNYQNFNVLVRLLFFPYKGLFFYSPILIFSFIGLFYMLRRNKVEAISIFFLFVSYLILFSLLLIFFCGFCFGFRYLLPILPFMILPLIYAFKKVNLKIILIFVFISIFFNILSLQYWESIQIIPSKEGLSAPLEEYMLERFYNFQILANPLFNHYLPLFIRNGPRSMIFESLLFNSNIDIRNTPHSCGLTPSVIKNTELPLFSLLSVGIVTLRIPFLSLIPISIFIFLIWRKEISRKVNLNFKQKLFVFSISIFIFIFGFVRSSTFLYLDNWYAPEFHDGKINENEKWMSQNATIISFNKNGENEKMNLILEIEAFNKTRILELYLNGNLVGRYQVYSTKTISQEMELEPGENIIKFYSVSGCDRPTELGLAGCDLRCLSFKIGDVRIE